MPLYNPPSGYTLPFSAAVFDPLDATNYYFGLIASLAPTTGTTSQVMYVPKAGVIKSANLFWRCVGTAGTGESITGRAVVNGATVGTISSVADTSTSKLFSNAAMSTPVAVGDTISLSVACPTWVTNPTQVYLTGVVYIEPS